MKFKVLLLMMFLSAGCNTYYEPNGEAFTRSWGKPPDIQTKDHRPLPHGYGHGSSTLYGWIMKNKEKEIQHRLNELPDSILLETINK